ncbi:hypothetical protein EKH57_14270 [Halorubrum sp. BOL3-1]|uniref:hypothetical protein n=1 Tax=Halorubrum sp. BOL3-1 TaxID=2497325 RepID=UPI001004F298|nr:hypothetical protein [Halorubrum sp. BOL3-1]QAU13794.1 hypothetical protein EKH57_14270 [Halorubrum sp. BOL3-1]
MSAEPVVTTPDELARADLLLLAFPICFAAVYGVLAVLSGDGVPPLAGASAVCCLLIVDCVFLNPPVDG